MQLDRLHFTYEREIRRLHSHLYGNANIRTPEGIAAEVLKVVKALMYARAPLPLSATTTDQKAILRDAQGAGPIARDTREAFASMNRDLRAYPQDTAIDLDNASVAAVRVHLAGFDFSGSDRDWLGDAIEIFRSITAKRIGGQFFTHPLVTDLAMTLLGYAPLEGDDLVDVCAGSGGFLLAGAQAIAAAEHDGGAVDAGPLGEPARRLMGLEADAELVRLSNSNLSMKTGEAGAFVAAADSLAPPDRWPAEVGERVAAGTHRCLASNPPFGSRLTVKDEQILGQYTLARRWTKDDGRWSFSGDRLRPRPPEVLFLERNLQLAEPGRGRVALVTPYQILSGPQAGYVREWLLRFARIVAVVDLPPTTFQPHTGTKASLLVYERREEPLATWSAEEDYPIFMAVADDIGHDRRGLPIFDESGNAVRTDLPDIARAFAAYVGGDDPSAEFGGAFSIGASELTNDVDLRLNAAFHRPSTGGLKRAILAFGEKPGWRVTTVGDVAEHVFVPGRFKRNYVENGDGIPFLGGTHISQFVPTEPKRLSPDDPHADQCVVHEGWILITRSGSTGIVSSVPRPWHGWAVSDHVIRVVPDPDELDPGYLEAYLRSDVGQRLLAAGVFGSVIDEITPEHVASIPIAIPEDPALFDEIVDNMRRAEAGRTAAQEGIATASAAIQAHVGV